MNIVANHTIVAAASALSIAPDGLEPVVDANALCDRVTAATPGEAITYFVGMLARDRDRLASRLSPDERIELEAIADCAWRLADAGWVHLVQHRVGPECFAYLVIVRPRPRQQRNRSTAVLAA
jgi:hypothetical protein